MCVCVCVRHTYRLSDYLINSNLKEQSSANKLSRLSSEVAVTKFCRTMVHVHTYQLDGKWV